MKRSSRLLKVTIFHAIFASFGDIEANVLNYLAVPIRNFFVESLSVNYGINAKSKEFEMIYSLVASSFFMGVLVGTLALAHCMDRFGRKGTSVSIRSILGMLSAALMMLSYYAGRIELFAIAQFVSGVISAFKSVLYIYLTECAPDESRGWSSTLFGSGGTIMLLFVAPICFPNILANDQHWWILPAICFVLALVHCSVGAFLPESPKHLYIGRSLKGEAHDAARFYHGSNVNLKEILKEYENERRVMHTEKISFTDLIKCHRLRWCLGIMLITAAIPGISILGLKVQYLEPMLIQFGLNQTSAMLSMMLINAVTSPICFIAPILIERFGRRPMFSILSVLSTCELLFVVVAQVLVDENYGKSSGWFVAALAIIGISLGQASVNFGLLNMTPILVGELCPYASRSIITQICQIFTNVLMLFLVLVYPSANASLGAGFLLPLLAGSFIFTLLLIKYLPETKGRPVDEIFREITVSDSDAALLDNGKKLSSESSSYGSMFGSEGSSSSGGIVV